MLFIGNELNERSTCTRVSSSIVWILVLLFMYTFNWLHITQWTPKNARIQEYKDDDEKGNKSIIIIIILHH